MEKNKLRNLIEEHNSDIDISISSDNKTYEDRLVLNNPHLNISQIPQSYRRYGYGLLSYCVKKFVFKWFEDYEQNHLFEKVQAKFTNSGMAAIDLALNVIADGGTKRIIAPKNLYFATDELIDSYKNTLFYNISRFNTRRDLEKLLDNVRGNEILYLETCANSPDMTLWEGNSIKELSREFEYVIVDGTLIGACKINPELFENDNVVYVESLSKNYHSETSSKITSGIIVYPSRLEELFQKRFYCSGVYLQLNDLMEIPIEIYDVGKERIMKISKNVQEFYKNAKKICQTGSIKVSELSDNILNTPLVVFLDFQNKSRLKTFMEKSQLRQRGSFGHNETYILPIGLMWDTAPPGLARIAFGKNSDNSKLYGALREVNN